MKSKIRMFMDDHATQILNGIGVAGVVASPILAIRATPKVLMCIEDKKDELETDKLEILDYIRIGWRPYLPTIAVSALSISCFLTSSHQQAKKSAILAAACTLSENAFDTYAAKTLEVVGVEKEQEIREAVAKKRYKDNPPTDNNVYIVSGEGVLCMDGLSGRYFKARPEDIKKAENLLERQILDDMSATVNDYYYCLGLRSTSRGDESGWHVEDGHLEFRIGSIISEDGQPCLLIEPSIGPRHDFRSY